MNTTWNKTNWKLANQYKIHIHHATAYINNLKQKSLGKPTSNMNVRLMCTHFPSELHNEGSVEKLITAVSKPDNHVACLWTCFHPEREGIDWSGFKVGGDLTVQSRSLRPCQWRGHPVGPIRSAWRQCNLSFVTYPAIEHQWRGLSSIFISSTSFSNQSVAAPRNWIRFGIATDLSSSWSTCRKIDTDIQEIDVKSANDARALETLSWASQRENLLHIFITVSKQQAQSAITIMQQYRCRC
jgi:hypothetical protein